MEECAWTLFKGTGIGVKYEISCILQYVLTFFNGQLSAKRTALGDDKKGFKNAVFRITFGNYVGFYSTDDYSVDFLVCFSGWI